MTQSLVVNLFHWFFIVQPRRFIDLGTDLMRWAWRYFSIGYFAVRLFSPWHRDLSGYGRGFDLKRFFHTLGWNLISRVIGAILRLVVMACGIAVEILLLCVWALVTGGWFGLPLAVLFFFVNGLRLLLL